MKSIAISNYKGADFGHAHNVLRKHYDLGRALTTKEVKAEIDNLIRKHNKGALDYIGEHLYAQIFTGGVRRNPSIPRGLFPVFPRPARKKAAKRNPARRKAAKRGVVYKVQISRNGSQWFPFFQSADLSRAEKFARAMYKEFPEHYFRIVD